MTAPAAIVRARSSPIPWRAPTSSVGVTARSASASCNSSGPRPAADDSLDRPCAAADGERKARGGWCQTLEVGLDLGPRPLERLHTGRIGGEQPARQPLRTEVDRTEPLRPVAARADRHLGRAAADVDDRDDTARRRLGRLDRAEERESPFLERAQDANRTIGSLAEHRHELAAVRRLTPGARDQNLQVPDIFFTRNLRESGDDIAGRLELPVRDAAVQLDVCPEAKHLAFGADRPATALDEQAHRVRADVDDTDGHGWMVTTPHDGAAS